MQLQTLHNNYLIFIKIPGNDFKINIYDIIVIIVIRDNDIETLFQTIIFIVDQNKAQAHVIKRSALSSADGEVIFSSRGFIGNPLYRWEIVKHFPFFQVCMKIFQTIWIRILGLGLCRLREQYSDHKVSILWKFPLCRITMFFCIHFIHGGIIKLYNCTIFVALLVFPLRAFIVKSIYLHTCIFQVTE